MLKYNGFREWFNSEGRRGRFEEHSHKVALDILEYDDKQKGRASDMTAIKSCSCEAYKAIIEAEREKVRKLREALKGLSDMYTYAWNLTEGGLIMFPESVDRFEVAHAKAKQALKDTE